MTNKPIWSKAPGTVIGGWAGLWNNHYGEQYKQIDSQNVRRGLGMALRNFGRYGYNQVIHSFVVGGIGTVASAPSNWIKAQDPRDSSTLGGKRAIVTHSMINRPVTAADQVAIQQDLAFNNSPPWPKDKSGNGGGGKRGY